MSDDNESIIFKLTTTRRSLIILLIGLILLWISFYLNIPFLTLFAQIIIGLASLLCINAWLRPIQMKTIEDRLTKVVSIHCASAIVEELRGYKNAKDSLNPTNNYWRKDDFNNDINKFLEIKDKYEFMSISGTFLLNKRLSGLNRGNSPPININLLLHDPKEYERLKQRLKYSQSRLTYFSDRGVRDYRKEIIKSVLLSYCLCLINNKLKIKIKFHNAFLIYRLEFCGDSDLFLSYYTSRKDEYNYGPVAYYQKDNNDVYRANRILFDSFWEASKIEINCEDEYATPANLLKKLGLGADYNDIIVEGINTLKETYSKDPGAGKIIDWLNKFNNFESRN